MTYIADFDGAIKLRKFFCLGEEEIAALDEVAHHCEMDVKVLAEAYWRMLPSVANLHR